MERIPEPQLMEDMEQAKAYSEADFEAPHSMFVELFVERFGKSIGGNVLDAGCGPADIAVRFAKACPNCTVYGVDASEAMLSFGKERVRAHGLEERVRLFKGLLPGVELPETDFDAIIVNSLLHHLPEPGLMWKIVQHYSKRKGQTQIFLMDLIRPESRDDARRIVEEYSGQEADVLKKDFYNSLLAAYRPEEVVAQLDDAGLGHLKVEVVSDRHFAVWGEVE